MILLTYIRPGQLQHVVEAIKHHLYDLGILAVEEAEYKELVAVKTAVCDLLAERLDDALGDEEGDLSFVAADGEVGDGPGRLLLCLELPPREVVDDHRHEAVLYDRLNLLLVPRRDV